jgi:hypothetical protein
MLAKHVDDLKIIGSKEIILWICKKLEEVFGPLKLIWNTFTNCGVRHIQDPSTKECSLDQIEYIAAFKPIVHAEITKESSDSLVSSDLQTLYMSLLGAVAFAVLTRMDAAVFVTALQRMSGKATALHVKRLNTLTRWLQKTPTKIVYARFKAPVAHIQAISDAAFRKEDEDAHALKGAVFMRVDGPPGAGSVEGRSFLSRVCHLIDYFCRKQRHVTRSTFGAELFSACDAADFCMLLAQLLHEIEKGACTAIDARQLRETGAWQCPIVLGIDAMSVFAAVSASNLKIPTEKGLWSHVQYLRELLDTGVLFALWWIDTRDMHADGLTKGSVDRDALRAIMQGFVKLMHEHKEWKPKRLEGRSTPESKGSQSEISQYILWLNSL